METEPNWWPYLTARIYAEWCRTNSGHVDFVCNVQHEDGGATCMFCAGGLAACSRCDAFEGATPSECPGIPMTGDQSDRVYEGIIDYRFGQWVSGGTVFMLYSHTPPPPDPVPGFITWNWDQIEEYIAAQEYEPRTVDSETV